MFILKRYSIYILIILPAFLCGRSIAQNIPDSLTNKLEHAANDSIKARTILDIGETIEAEFPEKSLSYYQQALELSKRIKNNRLVLSSTVDVGIAYIEI